ncbi:hypothetical protein V2J09_009999 [Rumex salicifolius]
MVAPVKNGNAHRSGGGGGGGGKRSYGLMLLLALGAAILGVIVLHKLREGRLFSLLVKEKDHELISLHLLLQKEREFNKEAKKKLEQMKTNMYSISAQKSDVEGRLLEVNSLVSSLKDEQKTLESQLEEKQSEIKTLRQQQQQMMPNEEIKFRDTSNQRQVENEDVKSHIEEPASVWSVSSDDPSKPPVKVTKEENENRKLEDSVEDGKSSSKSSMMNLNNGSEDETFPGQKSIVERKEKPDNSTEKPTEDGNGTVVVSDGLEDGTDSAIRVKKNSKQRRLKRRRYRDLIRRFTEGKNGHLEQNEVGASRKKTNTEAIEQTSQSTGTYTKQDESLNMAEKKEDKDSSGGKVEANSGIEEDQSSKEVDKGTSHFEDEEETKSNKDVE